MEVLEYCENDDQLVAAEQKYFNMHEWDDNCLNLGLVASPYKPQKPKPPKEKKEPKVKIVKPKKLLEKKEKPCKPVKQTVPMSSAEKLKMLKLTLDRLEKEYRKSK